MTTHTIPGWVLFVNKFNVLFSQNLLGGKKFIKLAWSINAHKALTPLAVIALMLLYKNFSTVAFVYLALHGSYGLCWVFKHFSFPDFKWETKVTFGGAAFTFLLLATYWIAPFLLISRPEASVVPDWFLAICIALHTLGVVIMISADCQKHFSLKYHKALITDGVFRYSRHPNYLGEMMVYASYALLAQHWLPWIVLAYWWLSVFLVNMIMAESSLSRYPDWKNYKKKTSFLFPGII
jgi:protein-S-isoprenylcysteine O-methyltransferase Ste14